MVYVIQVCWQLASRIRTELQFQPDPARKLSAKPVWHTPLLCVQWKTPDGGQRNCPKHVEFYPKNKFEKLVHLVGLIIRIYHDWRSPERQICINLIFFTHVCSLLSCLSVIFLQSHSLLFNRCNGRPQFMKLRIGLRSPYSSYGRITSTRSPSFCVKTVNGSLTLPYGFFCLSHMTKVITQAGDYWHFHRSDCRNAMIYEHTTSGTLLAFYVSLGSLKFPALEAVDFVVLILL